MKSHFFNRKDVKKGSEEGLFARIIKNVTRTAFEPLQDVFQSFERHILFAHFHPM